jgi:mevalonate kinase
MPKVIATAPAKAILFGEHAVNRGATALAVSVGIYATCTAHYEASPGEASVVGLEAGVHSEETTFAAIQAIGQQIDEWRELQNYAAIQSLVSQDFFAPAKYVLAGVTALPARVAFCLTSDIPPGSGLGSGGAAFVALAASMATMFPNASDPHWVAQLARRGDIVAHGGVASGLDTQTSLYGGAIRYTAEREAEPVTAAPGLALVVGHSGVHAPTSVVNGRVRTWLAEQPVRMHYFMEIGLLARYAERALQTGDWAELGRLMNLNQLLLERIGVSCPELEALNHAALAAGAYGAKLSGSGGGGIMIALVDPTQSNAVAQAIAAAGGTPIIAPVGVAGVAVSLTG